MKVSVAASEIARVVREQRKAGSLVFETLARMRRDLSLDQPRPKRLPRRLRGKLVTMEQNAAASVLVEVLAPDDPSWRSVSAVTDTRGMFAIVLPPRPITKAGLVLRLRSGTNSIDRVIGPTDLQVNTRHTLSLPSTFLVASNDGIPGALANLAPVSAEDAAENPRDFASPPPSFVLGEGDCAQSFHSNSGVIDGFAFSILFRLLEPGVSSMQLALEVTTQTGTATALSFDKAARAVPVQGVIDASKTLVDHLDQQKPRWVLRERLPVGKPIDVSAFHERIEDDPRAVPKAATLAVGYLLKMRQVWTPSGLSLGNLVYSLPLAPGETQRVAVREHRETLQVTQTESLSIEEQESLDVAQDESTAAIFSSALDEAARGGSRTNSFSKSNSESESSSGGFFLPIPGVGGGSSSTSFGSSFNTGSSSAWQNGSRNYASSAVQGLHSSVGKRALAQRRMSRTSMSLATSSDDESVTTRVVANHNKCHALTLQYWEVVRHFSVETDVDDASLVCFVPLELVPFLPEGEPPQLSDDEQPTRAKLLKRYAMLVRYFDVLEPRVGKNRAHRRGMRALHRLVANPHMKVQAPPSQAQETISITVKGTFLPFEDVAVTMVTKDDHMVGPIAISGAPLTLPTNLRNRDEVLGKLDERRSSANPVTYKGVMALPTDLGLADIARFEIRRHARTFVYEGTFTEAQVVGTSTLPAVVDVTKRVTVQISPRDLDDRVGGPEITSIKFVADSSAVTLAHDTDARRLAFTIPVAVASTPPIIGYTDLLHIEAAFQHVVRNTVEYSQAVWRALGDLERAILLERFTIGIPQSGSTDPAAQIPLLNCVANRVLGFFGNAMVMPFAIPIDLADSIGITTAQVQDALLDLHRESFAPAVSNVALPTRGVLSEAVLGECVSCEKIDLTRFWNWQDSPQPTVDSPSSAPFSGRALIGSAGATAADSLSRIPPLNIVNNLGGASGPGGADLLGTLVRGAPAATAMPDLTGTRQLADATRAAGKLATDAHNQALAASQKAANSAMGALTSIAKIAATVVGTFFGGPAGGAAVAGATSALSSAGSAGSGGSAPAQAAPPAPTPPPAGGNGTPPAPGFGSA